MELSKDYLLSQYQELGLLCGNKNVRIVRNAITGKIAVKKYMSIEQKPIYAFLKLHMNDYIPRTYDYFEDGQRLIVIEEYIEGRNLEDVLCEQRMSPEEGVRIVKELCRALYPLHAAEPSIVCRDLKPENIILTPQNHIKLIDFDIARVVSPGKNRDTVVMGTEGFAAPEQYGRRQTDSRSDIYALGTILNYIILQKFPVEEMADGKPGQIIRKCIAINPDERYQNVKELEQELNALCPSYEENNPSPPAKADRRQDTPAWRRFLPPGFRSGKLWKMVLAVIGYLMIFDLCLTMEVKDQDTVLTGTRALLQQILILIFQLAEVGVVFNYLDCQEGIPLLKSENWLVRISGYIISEFLLLAIALVLCVLLDDLIW